MSRSLKTILEVIALGIVFVFQHYVDVPTIFQDTVHGYHTTLGLIIVLLLLNISVIFINWVYRKKNKLPADFQDNFTQGVANIFTIFYFFATFAFFFTFLGYELKTVFTSLSIVAAAIAIVTKELLFDVIVGVLMSFSKDFDRNDYVKINELRGRIIEVGLLKLKLLNDDDVVVYIPNKKVYDAEVVNYTKRDIRAMSIDFQIALTNFGSLDELESKLKDSISTYQDYIENTSYHLKAEKVMKDYLDLKFQYTIKNLDREVQKMIRRQTNRKIISYITQKHSIPAGADQINQL